MCTEWKNLLFGEVNIHAVGDFSNPMHGGKKREIILELTISTTHDRSREQRETRSPTLPLAGIGGFLGSPRIHLRPRDGLVRTWLPRQY